jgi:large subunit ribosomal protein L6
MEAVEIPEGVTIKIEGSTLYAEGKRGKVHKELLYPTITLRCEDNKLIIDNASKKRKDVAMTGTMKAHIKNLIYGVTEGFEYKHKIFFAHFPMTVKVVGTEVVIDNFLGEKFPRRAKIVGAAKVEVKGDTITVSGTSLDDVGQTSSNLEQASRLTKRDLRVFQDGIYVYEKNGQSLR